MNPLKRLQDFGQSVWLDNISRGFIKSGGLKALIDSDGLRGVTSNPTIFQKAISSSADYDADIRALESKDLAPEAVLDALTIADIQASCDAFKPLWEASKGEHGHTSLEVSPRLAKDAQGTIKEAKRLWLAVNRPNVMIKIPATKEGLEAVAASIAEGINVNVTLIFSLERYAEVADAYLAGLDARAKAGKPVDAVRSVASVFVSRIDTEIDKRLKSGHPLRGKAAVANSKLVYRKFKEIFGSPRLAALKAKGAKVQRPLWASTGTKDPKYSDVLYVETLIGPDTVNTMPPATIDAFRDHGKARLTVEEDADGARATLESLPKAGVDLKDVMRTLEDNGVKAFNDSFDALLKDLETKQRQLSAA